MNNIWNNRIIDEVRVYMNYKKGKKDHAEVLFHFDGVGEIYPLTLSKEQEIDDCIEAFTTQTNMNKYQLEKYEKKLFYFDKDNYKDSKINIIENDLVNNKITKVRVGRPTRIVTNFKRVVAVPVLIVLLAGGYKLMKVLNSRKDFIQYRNPDNKIETTVDKKVINGSNRAKNIFNRLLEHQGNVSSEDIMFLTDFMTYASMTNSDFSHNATHTIFSTSDILYDELESSRDDFDNKAIKRIISTEKSLYKNSYIAPSSSRYSFNKKAAYKYFIYVTSLIYGGEDYKQEIFSRYYNESIVVADKTDSAIFRMKMTPLEKINIYTRIKGFLMGDFHFEYKDDRLSCYNLSGYNKQEYINWLDKEIAIENQKLVAENTKNTGKSR